MAVRGLAALGWARRNGTTLYSGGLSAGSADLGGPDGDLPADPVDAGGVYRQ
jgi:hypothetical protein